MSEHDDLDGLSWELLSSDLEHHNPVFRVERRRMRREAQHGDFFVLESPNWVNVVALTDRDELVLISQFRHGVGAVTVEIPGGCIDPGEEPLAAARRELAEETGYQADRWLALGSVHPNPAIQANRCHSFVALGARQVHAPVFDTHELCRPRLVPYSAIDGLVARGAISHALVLVALGFERMRREGRLHAREL